MASHKLSTASSADFSGKIFCAQSFEGIEIIDHGIRSFIVYLRKFFVASAAALLADASRFGSISFNRSGFVERILSTAAPSSANSLSSLTRHSGKEAMTSSGAFSYLKRDISSSAQFI